MSFNARAILALVLACVIFGVPASAQRKSGGQPLPGEDAFRSAAGYHAAAMEHCKQINRLARGKGAFNAELAREHAAEIARNLEAASRHQTSYLQQLGDRMAAEGSTVEQKLAESRRFATTLMEALEAGSPDRKAIASTVTDLYLAERELVTAQKAAGKHLGIGQATAPRRASTMPGKRKKKAAPAATNEEEVGAVAKPTER